MMTQDRDYEDALRRALTAAAESIEPAGDGLQRIRHRLDSPRSPRSVLSACTEWLELRGTRFLIRLEPVTEAGRTALRRSGPLAALVSFLRGLLSPRAARASRAAASRGSSWLARPPGAGRTLAQAGVRRLGGGGHRRGRRGHPQPRDGDPHQPVEFRYHAQQSEPWPWQRREDGELQAVDDTARGQSHSALSGRARNKNVPSKLPVVACTPTPTPTPAATTTAPAGTPSPSPTPTPSAPRPAPPRRPSQPTPGSPPRRPARRRRHEPTPAARRHGDDDGHELAGRRCCRTTPARRSSSAAD